MPSPALENVTIFPLFIYNGKRTGRLDVTKYDKYSQALKALVKHANKHKWSNSELDQWMDKNREPTLLIARVNKLTGDNK